MPRWNLCTTAGIVTVFAFTVALAGSLPARTQTTQTEPATSTPLTPAQQKALAAKEARQAAAEKAAEKRAEAAQNRVNAAQTKKAAATSTGAQIPAANTGLGSTANPVVSPGARTSAPPASPSTGTTPVGSGTLAWQTRVYTSTGCVHEGNSAVCTFTFANQGNAGTLVAGAEMAGIQLVDDAHVPHKAQSAHFLDKYGTQQPRLMVQPGDSGTYVLTFSNLNSQVTSADFHLRQQIVGGVTFSNAPTATPAPAPAVKKP